MLLILLMMEKSRYISIYNWTYCLSLFGESTCSGKPSEKSYDDLVTVMKTLYSPRQLVIIQYYRSFSRFRLNVKSLLRFVSELRNLAKDCEFGEELEENLRNKVVSQLMTT